MTQRGGAHGLFQPAGWPECGPSISCTSQNSGISFTPADYDPRLPCRLVWYLPNRVHRVAGKPHRGFLTIAAAIAAHLGRSAALARTAEHYRPHLGVVAWTNMPAVSLVSIERRPQALHSMQRIPVPSAMQ